MNEFYDKIIDELDKNSIWSGVDYSYGRTLCDCSEDYCRCTSIAHTKINSVDLNSLIDCLLYNKQNWKQSYDKSSHFFDYYIVDRLFRICKLYSCENWEVNRCPGYYGEETDGCSLSEELKIRVISYLKEISILSNYDKILKILELEYGFILDRLKNFADIEIIETDISNIKIVQVDYGRKVLSEDLSLYKNYNLIHGICTKNSDNSFSIIDGYHRVLAAQQYNKSKIKILVLK